jgi:hypothetical protein
MNTIRITSIPMAYATLGIDLSHGLLHDLLGYCTMALALVLMLSTDELLLKIGEHLPNFQFLASKPAVRTAIARRNPIWLTTVVAIPLAVFFVIQCYDVSESWGKQRKVIDFFRGARPLAMMPADAPTELTGWPQVDYIQTNRAPGNDDLGQRSDLWYYAAPFGKVSLSFDQMFPGWHELTRCYYNAGWTPVKRTVAFNGTGEWPLVMVELKRDREFGFLVFSLVNKAGIPLQPPGDFNYWTILQERLRGRVTPAVRGAVFGVDAFQMQAFVQSYQPLRDDQREQTVERFLIGREVLWKAAEQRLANEDS